jgi:hypothetical protein
VLALLLAPLVYIFFKLLPAGIPLRGRGGKHLTR